MWMSSILVSAVIRKTETLISVKMRGLSPSKAKALAPVQKPTGRFDDVSEGLAHGSRPVIFDATFRSVVLLACMSLASRPAGRHPLLAHIPSNEGNFPRLRQSRYSWMSPSRAALMGIIAGFLITKIATGVAPVEDVVKNVNFALEM